MSFKNTYHCVWRHVKSSYTKPNKTHRPKLKLDCTHIHTHTYTHTLTWATLFQTKCSDYSTQRRHPFGRLTSSGKTVGPQQACPIWTRLPIETTRCKRMLPLGGNLTARSKENIGLFASWIWIKKGNAWLYLRFLYFLCMKAEKKIVKMF